MRQLLMIRHAIAVDRSKSLLAVTDDNQRALTEAGRNRMRRGAAGLTRLVPAIDILASSPLLRARQTAEIIASAFGIDHIEVLPVLAPGGSPEALLDWLRAQDSIDCIGIVGHEPDLGEFACWLLTSQCDSFITFKKGGAILIDFPAGIVNGKARLCWACPPRVLRQLAED